MFVPRQMEERASVILPTVTCSTCSAPIPLSSLTDHICRPPPAAGPSSSSSSSFQQHQQSRMQPRQPPKLAHINIPPNDFQSRAAAAAGGSSNSFRGPGSYPSEPSPSFMRPFANSPASSLSSPTSLNIPLHNPSPASLKAPSPAFGAPSPRTPSPTNPFFPQQSPSPDKAVIVHGLGLGVGKPQGPFPTDAPLPPGVQDPMASAPEMMSGGNAGMAGVGRRAFAAAAWGVRAGVALAQGVQGNGSGNALAAPSVPSAPQLPSQAFPLAPPHRGPSPAQQIPPAHRGPTPVPTHAAGPSSIPDHRIPSPQPPPQRVLSPTLSDDGATPLPRPTRPGMPMRTASPTIREPPILPRVPLANRPRGQTVSNGSRPADIPAPVPAPPVPCTRTMARQHSIDSTSSHGSPIAEPISQLLKARQGSGDQLKPSNKAFFDKYKAMVATSSGSSTPSGTASPMLGFGAGLSRRNSDNDKVQITDSPERRSDGLPDEDDSALPWARSLDDHAVSPDLSAIPKLSHQTQPPSQLRRHRPAQSEGSSNSRGGASVESEEVVTPSASWEGISEQHDMRKPSASAFGMMNDRLEEIREDETEERVVFGTQPHSRRERSRDRNGDITRCLKSSHSSSTLASANTGMYDPQQHIHARSNTAPERRGSSSTSASRRTKTCAKCNEVVGGSKRFVERDGVVLCEKDWKKLYLPSCRRCLLPIEKSAVSSSDGQLKGKWHRACFTCAKCDEPFEGDSFYVLGGKPWCQYHYHEENGTLCASESCRKPIEGKCILTPDMQRFHPGHLRCDHVGPAGIQSCREDMDEYYEVGKERYCERHVSDALRRKGGQNNGRGGLDVAKAEKRRTRLVDMSGGGGLGGLGGTGGFGSVRGGIKGQYGLIGEL